MRVTGLGKFILFILAIGVALGGYKVWQQSSGAGGTSGGLKLPGTGGKSAGNGSGGNAGGNSGGSTGGSADSRGSADAGGGSESGSANDILLVTSASKKGWLQDQIAKFNNANAGKYRVTTKFLETREAMHAILDNKVKPVIYCPSSTIWAARLAQAWQQKNNGAILDTGDPNTFRVFLRTPLVFITTQSKARFLRPLLGGPRAWESLLDLSSGRRKAPWGRFKFAHADPLNANSGMMTLGLIFADYAQQTGVSGDQEAANSQRFRTYLQSLERGLIYDLPVEGGSSALMKAFIRDPSRYDFITNYENSALEAARDNPNIAVIYPNPTAVSEHVVSVLSGDWVSAQQREGATAFVRFLGGERAIREGLQYYFRPAQPGSTTLAPTLARYRSQGFQQTFSSIELPPYDALNAAAFQWRIHIAKKPPTD